MATLTELMTNFKKLNIDTIIKKSINTTSYDLLDLQKQQLRKGLRSDGSIQKNYSKASQVLFLKPDIPIQLFDTGEFYGNLKMELTGDDIKVFSDDDKHSLQLRYSKGAGSIFGLTDEFAQKYTNKYALKEVQSEITQITGLKFE